MIKSPSKKYFQKLNATLKSYERAIPSLLIDLDRIDKNIETLKSSIHEYASFRVVVKSLPSFPLIKYVLDRMKPQNLMVFHQPFLTDLSSNLSGEADILLGKPMPVQTARYYYRSLPERSNDFDPYRQIQWLVDTELRIEQYIDLAEELGKKLRLNLELDVGLHRGGFASIDDLRKALEVLINNQDKVELSGFMGYDPHVVKIPKILRSTEKSLRRSNDFYHQCKRLLQEEYSALWNDNLTFNGAGSPTVDLHRAGNSPLNDVAAGSCLVMPTTFDIPTLNRFEPACFIATPILKKFKGTTIPGLKKIKSILSYLNARNSQSFFIYGGFWKADYCYPLNIKPNQLFGPSTNQTMINGPKSVDLSVDDFVFLRPHQSEFVFLQFGKLLVVRQGEITDKWSVLSND